MISDIFYKEQREKLQLPPDLPNIIRFDILDESVFFPETTHFKKNSTVNKVIIAVGVVFIALSALGVVEILYPSLMVIKFIPYIFAGILGLSLVTGLFLGAMNPLLKREDVKKYEDDRKIAQFIKKDKAFKTYPKEKQDQIISDFCNSISIKSVDKAQLRVAELQNACRITQLKVRAFPISADGWAMGEKFHKNSIDAIHQNSYNTLRVVAIVTLIAAIFFTVSLCPLLTQANSLIWLVGKVATLSAASLCGLSLISAGFIKDKLIFKTTEVYSKKTKKQLPQYFFIQEQLNRAKTQKQILDAVNDSTFIFNELLLDIDYVFSFIESMSPSFHLLLETLNSTKFPSFLKDFSKFSLIETEFKEVLELYTSNFFKINFELEDLKHLMLDCQREKSAPEIRNIIQMVAVKQNFIKSLINETLNHQDLLNNLVCEMGKIICANFLLEETPPSPPSHLLDLFPPDYRFSLR